MKIISITCRTIGFICLLVSLVSCGGGGSSNNASSSSASKPDLTACLNFKAPAAPTVKYNGNTNEFSMNEASATSMVAVAYKTITILDYSEFQMPIANTVSQDFCFDKLSNTNTGTVKTVYLAHSDGSGWEYQKYSSSSTNSIFYAISGTAYATYKPLTKNGSKVTETIELTNFRIGGTPFVGYQSIDVTFNGVINVTAERGGPSEPYSFKKPISANLIIHDNLNNKSIWVKDVTISDDIPDPVNYIYTNRTVSGTIYDSALGYAILNTTTPLYYDTADEEALADGPLKLSGNGTSIIYSSPINRSFMAVSLDENGDGVWNKSVRTELPDMSVDTSAWTNSPTPMPIISLITAKLPALVNQKMPIDGLRSYSPYGTYVTFSWSLEFSPPGSKAVIKNASSAVPNFVPDLPGDYQFLLTVSDGASQNTEEKTVRVFSSASDVSSANGYDPSLYLGNAGPDLQVHVGDKVVLDSRASDYTVGGFVPDWSLRGPAGSNVALSYADDSIGEKISFVPDVPGYYLAIINSIGSPGGFLGRVLVGVDAPINFHKSVTLAYSSFSSKIGNFVVGDFNNDGNKDVAITITDIFTSDTVVTIFYGKTKSKFYDSVDVASLGSVDAPSRMEVNDVNNDGLDDIVMNGANGTTILLQNGDGTMSSPMSITADSPCSIYSDVPQLYAIGPWNTFTGNVIYTYAIGNCLDIHKNTSANTFTTVDRTTLPINEEGQVKVQDVTGDGIPDFVIYNWYGASSTSPASIDVLSGQPDGSFSKTASYPISNSSYGQYFVMGDFDHDGLADIAAMDNSDIAVLLQGKDHYFSSQKVYTSFDNHEAIYGVHGLGAGDINGDGRDDLFIQHLGTGVSLNSYARINLDYPFYPDPVYGYVSELGMYLQNSGGTLNNEFMFPFLISNWQQTTTGATVSADLNEDGIPDVIMFDGADNLIILYGKTP